MGKREKRAKRGQVTQLLEYGAVYTLLLFSRAIPKRIIYIISSFLGTLFYLLVKKRRTISMGNLRSAFAGEKDERELRKIARRSCKSFFLTFLEIAKLQHMVKGDAAFENLKKAAEGIDELFQKAKKIHDDSGGCIFVTPHIGNWEFLPHLSSLVGISLVVVVRPLDNRYLEKLIFKNRAESGQVIIPKRNALFVLQETLRQGKSIGMLPDQSTMQGISVDFFGRKATTTPVPALLAVMYKRPIVVVACCRKADSFTYNGIVSDPLWPGEYKSEKEEIFRLTEEMNRKMESIIRTYPDQYLWMHNRWKTYRDKKGIFQ